MEERLILLRTIRRNTSSKNSGSGIVGVVNGCGLVLDY